MENDPSLKNEERHLSREFGLIDPAVELKPLNQSVHQIKSYSHRVTIKT